MSKADFWAFTLAFGMAIAAFLLAISGHDQYRIILYFPYTFWMAWGLVMAIRYWANHRTKRKRSAPPQDGVE